MSSKNTSNTAGGANGDNGANGAMSASGATTSHTAHASLYRAYRPAEFKDVIGQEHVVSVLEDSVKAGKIAHAYLFCGGRGTGKTSVARIFAKMLGTTDKDLYEIDAASNTSVDDIRNLNESVHSMPFDSQYKVYILDEVHMLSKSAFNAFLKTLEEPPKHVIFILATTELQKLPDTVISRCQTFQFKKPNVSTLKKVTIDIAKKEGVKIDEDGANLIALLGDGSFRDTLSVLQKVLSLAGGAGMGAGADSCVNNNVDAGVGGAEGVEIKLSEIEKITGAPQKTIVNNFVKGVLLNNASSALSSLESIQNAGLDVKLFSELTLESVRKLLLASMGVKNGGDVSVGGDGVSNYDEELIFEIKNAKVSPKRIAVVLEFLLKAHSRLGKSAIATLPLELAVAECVDVAEYVE